MSRRRLRRKAARAQRQTKTRPSPAAALPDPAGPTAEWFRPAAVEAPSEVVVREAGHVERLAYTRTQAAEALGIGRSTFTQRVLPYIETVQTPWGTQADPSRRARPTTDRMATPGATATSADANRPTDIGKRTMSSNGSAPNAPLG
jgi:hypothetical protein